MKDAGKRFILRKSRVRRMVSGTAERPRLSVYRGHKHMYAQLIDDTKGATLAAASTLSPELKGTLKVCDTIPAAAAVGALIAVKAKEKKIAAVVFDRGGYVYTGRIKALADAARKGGLQF